VNTIDVTIGRDGTDEQTPARLMICTEVACRGASTDSCFRIFTLLSGHQHLQCVFCDTSYCDGSCGNVQQPLVQ